jgi:ribulose-phosphate 3-epimerase
MDLYQIYIHLISLFFQVGLAIKPETEVEVVEKYADQVDLILIMTVRPGFGGQKFMADMMPKVS